MECFETQATGRCGGDPFIGFIVNIIPVNAQEIARDYFKCPFKDGDISSSNLITAFCAAIFQHNTFLSVFTRHLLIH